MNATPERWLPMPDWEQYYEVSDHGRVRGITRVDSLGRTRIGRIMSLGAHPLGYKTVTVSGGGKRTTKLVHSMVITAFVGPRPEGLNCCHNDGNPANNHVSNLRWDTQSSNLLDAVKHGTHTLASKTHCIRGHEFTEQNTRVSVEGWRSCRECQNERARNGLPNGAAVNAAKTHCPQGHEYTPENTFLHSTNGGRCCRTCQREKARDYARRRRAAKKATPAATPAV
ncbi:NUMOD4 domain-containing protein [Mycolicibacterium gilvum]|uniref:NUMOD4 domain-containing protein n=1 Tax=Mycolicibacterium gilvum TaxID=1804 RepID=UPI0040452C00